jgi:dCMP deaminase
MDKFDEYYMKIAVETSKLSTAKKLQVGCIIVKNERTISIGYNGTPSGWDNNCEDLIDGKLVTKPEVLHAEMNAISKLAKSPESAYGATMYLTHSPCLNCSKMIYQSGIGLIIYKEDFRTNEGIVFLNRCEIPIIKYNNL